MKRRASQGALRRKASQESPHNQRNLARVYDLYLQANEEVKQLKKKEKETAQKLRHAETAVAKSKKLSQEVTKLKEELAKNQRQLSMLEHKYNALSNSKLGKLTLKKWERRKRKREAEETGVTRRGIIEPRVIDTQGLAVWVSQFDDAIDAMPVSNGSRFYEKSNLRIGIVADAFFYESIAAATDFIPLHSHDWQETLQKDPIDVLLFVTAWRGLDEEESWRGLSNVQSLVAREAFALMDSCKENGIPVIFYSKEDPPNYEVFLPYAQYADCVFTSATECIPDYIRDCGHSRVYPLLFGINPLLHNPVGLSNNRSRTVLFSGSWTRKYPDRCDALSTMFDGVIASGYDLHIIDRNTGNEHYLYPGRYQSYVSPVVEHQKLQRLHKLFDWAINVNSVTASETMFANRVYELQASGVLLLSNYSVGVNTLQPNVFMVHEAMEVPRILNTLTGEELYEKKVAGIRSVYDGNTCFDRLADLLVGVGIDFTQPCRSVLVIADEVNDGVRGAVERQTYSSVDLVAQSELTRDILDEHDMVTWFDAEAYYGEFYLEDLINGFKYTDSSYITKDAWWDGETLHEGVEHNYVTRMPSRYRTLFWRSSFDTDFYLNPPDGSIDLPNGYAIDYFSYNAQAPARKQQRETPYKLSVVVPVYNNGRYLQSKCFASLRRSTIFEDMEIILVDDGSTDDYTLKVEDYLECKYSNVISYRYNDGGSGSASRPRNKGVELASADYITFLDPDNEAICDGYAYLYNEALNNNLDIAFGNIYICGRETRLQDYHRFWKNTAKKVEGEFNFAKEGSLPALSIQAMVIRRAFLRDEELTQVEGAAGQDTLFSWQLVNATRAVYGYPLPIHVYYEQTAGSVTNTVKPIFFEKLIRLQSPKIQWLCDSDLMDVFMDKRYVDYTRGVLFRKFAIAEEQDECIKYIAEYLADYAPYYDGRDEGINRVAYRCMQGEYDSARDVILELVGPVSTHVDVNPFKRNVTARKKSIFEVDYQVKGASITFCNMSVTSKTDRFAWVIREYKKQWESVYASQYVASSTFTYDFSCLAPGVYTVTAFRQKKKSAKERSDVMVLRVRRDLTISIDGYATPANDIP